MKKELSTNFMLNSFLVNKGINEWMLRSFVII